MRNSFRRATLIGLGAAAFLATQSTPTAAHDIPVSVAVLAYLKPAGHTLQLIVRVPLESMRDMEWPMRGPYLELTRVDTLLRNATEQWISNHIDIREGNRELGRPTIASARISLPSDRSFEQFESALNHVRGAPLDSSIDIAWQNAMLDVLLEWPITSDSARFSIDPQLARLGVRTRTILHFLPAGHGERIYEYSGDPGLVRLDPRWHQAAFTFVKLGFEHILSGIDHLLFILCLVIPVRRLRSLIAIVTAFTVAHSITLIASAKGLAPTALWFPPLIEVLIAASIVYMAFENIIGARIERRWMIAFGFGLVHGFGFSFALRESLQFAGTHLLTSLFTFNVGVELGQILVLLIALPVLGFVYTRVTTPRMGTILLSALIAHTAWHWMTARGAVLAQYQFEWPAFDAAFFAAVLRVAMMLLIIAAGVWAVNEFVVKRRQPNSAQRVATHEEV